MAKHRITNINMLDSNRIKELYWNQSFNAKEIAKKFDISAWSLYHYMAKHGIPRRSYSEANYLVNKDKPKFKVKEILNNEEQKLKIAGIMLYWAEGTLRGSTVDFANSSPDMVRIFLRFLRNICGVNEERLRVYLYGYSYSDVEKLKTYWHNVTNIPLIQFTKPYIREGHPNISKRKLEYGMVHIRYNDKRLLDTIGSWIKEYINDHSVVRYQSGQMDQTVKNAAS